MNQEKFESIVQIGENVAVEFKRCGNGIENDVYESVCSFFLRFYYNCSTYILGNTFYIIQYIVNQLCHNSFFFTKKFSFIKLVSYYIPISL